jgi:hydroxymethylbilane synthase
MPSSLPVQDYAIGIGEFVSEWLSLDVMLPAPGQGALAVQCRAEDTATLELLAALEDDTTRTCVTAERAFLSGLGGGCAVPVAAYAEANGRYQGTGIRLTGLVISEDGRKFVKVHADGTDPLELGQELAEKAIRQGADEILNTIAARQ